MITLTTNLEYLMAQRRLLITLKLTSTPPILRLERTFKGTLRSDSRRAAARKLFLKFFGDSPPNFQVAKWSQQRTSLGGIETAWAG
jgi:hypothetical protein